MIKSPLIPLNPPSIKGGIKERIYKGGITEIGILSPVSDNGSQPTSGKFINEASILGIKQVFASYDNPKGNADTERVIRTLKEDLVWTREWTSLYPALLFSLPDEYRVKNGIRILRNQLFKV